MAEPPPLAQQPTQLDLFLDGQVAMLINEIVAGLTSGRPDDAQQALDRLRERDPAHPDLAALEGLCRANRTDLPVPKSVGALIALIDEVQSSLFPAAQRLLGAAEAARALDPVWRRVADAARTLALDGGDSTAALRYWVARAHYRVGEHREAFRLWLSLCWLDPAAFAGYAPTLPSSTLREAWSAFERQPGFDPAADGEAHPARWFPAWLVLRERGLVHLFHEDEIPETGAAGRAVRRLLTLLPLERQGHSAELVRQRRELRQVSPAFFRHYLKVVGG